MPCRRTLESKATISTRTMMRPLSGFYVLIHSFLSLNIHIERKMKGANRISNSEDTQERARGGQVETLSSDTELVQACDYILSIVPPRDALVGPFRSEFRRKLPSAPRIDQVTSPPLSGLSKPSQPPHHGNHPYTFSN
jgi:hypothetical protein